MTPMMAASMTSPTALKGSGDEKDDDQDVLELIDKEGER